MRSGRQAVLLLVGGSLLLLAIMVAWILPSLRPYRNERRFGSAVPAISEGTEGRSEAAGDGVGSRHAESGAPAASTPAPVSSEAPARELPQLAVGEPGAGASLEAHALQVTGDPESQGRVVIEPAPFQPPPPTPPREPEAPRPEPPPPPADSSPEPAEGGGAATGAGGGGDALATRPVLEPPVVLKAAWLSYPESARKRKAEGSTEVRIHVSESGGVLDVVLATTAGDSALDRAALEAARTITFRPARMGARNVAVWYNYRFVFTVPR